MSHLIISTLSSSACAFFVERLGATAALSAFCSITQMLSELNNS